MKPMDYAAAAAIAPIKTRLEMKWMRSEAGLVCTWIKVPCEALPARAPSRAAAA